MAELQFCKQFLSALDSRPRKLSSDHIADARQYPSHASFTLPRLPHPAHPLRPAPPSSSTTSNPTPNSPKSYTITLRPMKPTTSTISLSNITPSTTSIFDLKQSYATETSVPVSKIKILFKKRPVTDSKTVAEVVGQEASGEVEFSVMVLGGGANVASPAPSPAGEKSEGEKGLGADAGAGVGGPVAVGPSGKEVVASEAFWEDLRGFVVQRIKDEEEGNRLTDVFKAAWGKDR
ncbi:hypothetical protein M011DRAFT_442763 [Sporormia fimetaria CBS 119925]|uniref:Ubiquitin-like domain-containing protein n=1 Tax=Sporormia fimetaria CBS 119925 TaxID=1340428 RepID=A0A6A6VAX4_9PLEO|nr:hypothetical protein M011DRAFT_442763 [Sporormia fimetaria CBS 119925]